MQASTSRFLILFFVLNAVVSTRMYAAESAPHKGRCPMHEVRQCSVSKASKCPVHKYGKMAWKYNLVLKNWIIGGVSAYQLFRWTTGQRPLSGWPNTFPFAYFGFFTSLDNIMASYKN